MFRTYFPIGDTSCLILTFVFFNSGILTHLRKQDKDNSMNVVHLFEHFSFRNHICMTFELLSYNLYEVIKRNKFQGFSLHLVRKFALNIILCLDALHKNKIIHCDLKPENVLLKTKVSKKSSQ